MNIRPTSIEEVQGRVPEAQKILPHGSRTKPALSTAADGVTALDMTGIAGVLDYEPGEFTFTALAGTRVADVKPLLDRNNQYLPFDPPLVERGATLGGTVAAGLSGPGRYRYGGVRDFLIGIGFVNAQGQLVHSGGKVVKNAAGFDISKLMIGSMGRLGILVELSFKVFPKPEAYVTVRRETATLDTAVETMLKFASSPVDLDAYEIEVLDKGAALWARIGGLAKGLPPRLERLLRDLGGGEVREGKHEAGPWTELREMAWVPGGWSLVKVPLTPARIPAFDQALQMAFSGGPVLRCYSGGGQQAWIATQEPLKVLDLVLLKQELSGLVIFGSPDQPRLGVKTGEAFARRVKFALDPVNRFMEV